VQTSIGNRSLVEDDATDDEWLTTGGSSSQTISFDNITSDDVLLSI
jgi:hypothetical protein